MSYGYDINLSLWDTNDLVTLQEKIEAEFIRRRKESQAIALAKFKSAFADLVMADVLLKIQTGATPEEIYSVASVNDFRFQELGGSQ